MPVKIPGALWRELGRRMSLVFVGHGHSSSDVHEMVIRELEGQGPEAPKLAPLRRTARHSADALRAGDLAALGRAMVENTLSQAALHPGLIGEGHRRIIDIARRHGAWGWKVNGAGGAGGSVTILHGPDEPRQRELLRAIEQDDPAFRLIPIQLSRRGLAVWETARARPMRAWIRC